MMLTWRANTTTCASCAQQSHRCCLPALQIQLGPPLFVPNGQIGSFGSVSQIKSLVGSRRDLFDYAISGPAAAGAVSALLFLVGLGLSTSGLPRVRSPSVFPRPMYASRRPRSPTRIGLIWCRHAEAGAHMWQKMPSVSAVLGHPSATQW